MATKKELIETATELAVSLGIEIDCDGLSHGKLTALVKDLNAKQTDAETVTQADTPVAKVVVETVETDTPVAKVYKVAHGKCITSKRGMIGEGNPVEVKDLAAGEDALLALVKKGVVVWE
jgi:autotransporter adhesin